MWWWEYPLPLLGVIGGCEVMALWLCLWGDVVIEAPPLLLPPAAYAIEGGGGAGVDVRTGATGPPNMDVVLRMGAKDVGGAWPLVVELSDGGRWELAVLFTGVNCCGGGASLPFAFEGDGGLGSPPSFVMVGVSQINGLTRAIAVDSSRGTPRGSRVVCRCAR